MLSSPKIVLHQKYLFQLLMGIYGSTGPPNSFRVRLTFASWLAVGSYNLQEHQYNDGRLFHNEGGAMISCLYDETLESVC